MHTVTGAPDYRTRKPHARAGHLADCRELRRQGTQATEVKVVGGPHFQCTSGGQSSPVALRVQGVRNLARLSLRVRGGRRRAVGRHFSRAGCGFWRLAAYWRLDGEWEERGRCCGRPLPSEAPGRLSLGQPLATPPRGRPAAEALGCGELCRFSCVPCLRRSAFGGLAGPSKGGWWWT